MGLVLLEEELILFLGDVQQGDFYQRFQVDTYNRVIKDVAISGNGELPSARPYDVQYNSLIDYLLK
ncbi:hypothetical protein [Methyloglobulus sp.]|uniref:hypothetical protein n=1 Tax=Methyloglobulus sp. TaxID=2518622 RepID=UPI0039892443